MEVTDDMMENLKDCKNAIFKINYIFSSHISGKEEHH